MGSRPLKTCPKTHRRSVRRFLRDAGYLAALSVAAACAPPVVSPDDSDLSGDLHPRTMFDVRVKPQLQGSCAACHAVAQGAVQAFLPPGSEYESIVGYKNGAFLTAPAVQSPLLQKGRHAGPALTPEQFADVQAWLEAEAAMRPGSGGAMKSGLLPTVPLESGDFNMSFADLDPILDPQANLTFKLSEGENLIFRVFELKLSTGPLTGIRIKHPVFYFITPHGSYPDPADSLKNVDLQVPPNGKATVGTGGLLLTQTLPNKIARIGVAFEVLERYNMNPGGGDPKCKAFNLFNPAVKQELAPCAMSCHAPGKNNVANGAFNMEAATSSDNKTLQAFCLGTLGRVNKASPGDSILIKQITPPAQGGTPNHPYKQNDNAARTRFADAVKAWAAAEK